VCSWCSLGGSCWSDAGASTLLIVDADSEVVERELRARRLACPECGSLVSPRGHGRRRPLRVAGGDRDEGIPDELVWLRPRRACCLGCGAWHVLLPCVCLCRRLDAVEVIGRALVLAARGVDFRRIAEELGLPESTVRNWLRRARLLAERIREHFTRWGFALDPALADGGCAGSGLAAAVDAVGRCGRVAVLRLGRRSPWQLASAMSGGGLLCTSGPWIEPP
jgi:hypothetical protein